METSYTPFVCGLLAALFIVVPAVEIYLILEVGGQLGGPVTFVIILLTGLIGAALARHQGLWALRKVREAFARGHEVGRSLVSGALLLVAAAFLVTPGFLTDVTGFALLVPPLRDFLATRVLRRYAARVISFAPGAPGSGDDPPWGGEGVHHGDEHDPPPPGVIDV